MRWMHTRKAELRLWVPVAMLLAIVLVGLMFAIVWEQKG